MSYLPLRASRQNVWLQDPAYREGLVAALVALIALAKMDNSICWIHQTTLKMLGSCMELVVERRALKARDGLYFTTCMRHLNKCLETFNLGTVQPV